MYHVSYYTCVAIGDCRLPVVQAGTFALLVPTLAYLSLPQWTCPNNIVKPGWLVKFGKLVSGNDENCVIKMRMTK